MSDKQDRGFWPVTTLKTPEGVIAVITARAQPNGRRQLTFQLKKEFDKNGEIQSTPWLQKQHLGALRKLLDAVEAALELEEDRDRAAVRAGSTR
jgi:hypothetical protein